MGLALASLAACSTDVELNAPFKERPVIYAALDAAAPVQLVRVQRSFLTINDPDANNIAKNRDSIYYRPGAIRVTMRPVNRANGALLTPVVTLADTTIAKDTGLFAGGDQLVFRTPAGFRLDATRLYQIVVERPNSELRVTALTNVLPNLTDADILVPAVGVGGQRFLRGINTNIRFNVRQDSVRRYSVAVDMRIREVYGAGQGDSTVRFRNITWNPVIDREPRGNLSGGQVTVSYDAVGNDRFAFYDFLRTQLDTTDPNLLVRRFDQMTLRISTINNRLTQYISAVRDFNVLTQTRPFYTNVLGGVGVVGSRNISTFAVRPSAPDINTAMGTSRYAKLRFRP